LYIYEIDSGRRVVWSLRFAEYGGSDRKDEERRQAVKPFRKHEFGGADPSAIYFLLPRFECNFLQIIAICSRSEFVNLLGHGCMRNS